MASIETPEHTEYSPVTPEQTALESSATSPLAVQRRLQQHLVISILLFIVCAAILAKVRFTIGVIIGGGLSYLNYRWLFTSLHAIITTVAAGGLPPTAVQAFSKFILRWVVMLAAVAIANWLGGDRLALGILTGLLSIGGAVMLESFAQTWFILRGR